MFGIGDTRANGRAEKSRGKDLQRLSRQDLLELLVGQLHEGDELHATIEQETRAIEELNGLVNRLKERLDLKDEKVDSLKQKLDLKDEQIERLKDKLNDKDMQIDRLKVKLDDKDALIEKLKHRLDEKDRFIVQLVDAGKVNSDEVQLFDSRQHVEDKPGEEGVA